MTTYEISDGYSADLIQADNLNDAKKQAREWILGGDWGIHGASIRAEIQEINEDGQRIAGSEIDFVTEIEPDHAALIYEAALGNGCGNDPGNHQWTSEGEGGCDENPGVWSTGGTSTMFKSHCSVCGLQRIEKTTGSQRDPGDHDTVEYLMPDCDE